MAGTVHLPALEWSHYSMGTKIKNLLFSFGAIGISFISVGTANRRLNITATQLWISILLVICIGGHTIQHFFFHRPCGRGIFSLVYISVLACAYFGLTQWIKASAWRGLGPMLYTAAIVLVFSRQGRK